MNAAVVIRRAGGLDQIAVEQTPDPKPVAGEVRIRIKAAGVAFGDIMLRKGIGGGRFPVTPGYDLVGVIDEIGPAAKLFNIGDRVVALPGVGGQQALVCLQETELVAAPAGIADEKVVGAVLNYLTAYQLLTRSAKLKAGDTAFIYGIAGALGNAMLQIARVLNIRLHGTASAHRGDQARAAGAVVYDRDDPNWTRQARTEVPRGFDAVFDPVGGKSLNRSYRLLSKDGCLVMLGASSAAQGKGNGTFELIDTMLRLAALKFRPRKRRVEMYLVMQMKKAHPDYFLSDLQTLMNWLRDGQIDPAVAAVLPLEDVRMAQERVANGSGKVVLRP